MDVEKKPYFFSEIGLAISNRTTKNYLKWGFGDFVSNFGIWLVEQPLLYVREDEKRNLSIFFSQLDQYDRRVFFPAAVLFMAPVFLWYLMYHKELREGLKYHR